MQNNLSNILKNLSLPIKIILLVTLGVALFGSHLLVSAQHLDLYFVGLVSVIAALVWLGYLVLSKKVLKNTVILWGVGVVIYLLFAIPRIYYGGMLTPYFNLTSIYERWFYSLLFPAILLGSFIVGLIFMRITSPLEFLRWGDFGFKLALIFRALQHSMQVFQSTKTALMMRGEWPDEQGVDAMWLAFKSSPLLIGASIRNIILFWFPWGWLSVLKLQQTIDARKKT